MLYHRFAATGHCPDSPTAVRTRWAFRDFLEAHVICDHLEREAELAREEAEREAERRRHRG